MFFVSCMTNGQAKFPIATRNSLLIPKPLGSLVHSIPLRPEWILSTRHDHPLCRSLWHKTKVFGWHPLTISAPAYLLTYVHTQTYLSTVLWTNPDDEWTTDTLYKEWREKPQRLSRDIFFASTNSLSCSYKRFLLAWQGSHWDSAQAIVVVLPTLFEHYVISCAAPPKGNFVFNL